MFTFHTQTQAHMLPGTKRAPFVFDSERDTVVETIRTAHQGKPLLCIIWVCLSRVSLRLRFTHKHKPTCFQEHRVHHLSLIRKTIPLSKISGLPRLNWDGFFCWRFDIWLCRLHDHVWVLFSIIMTTYSFVIRKNQQSRALTNFMFALSSTPSSGWASSSLVAPYE